MPDTAVHVQNVSHRYGDHTALRDVTLTIPSGALYGVLGPNGSGKTTLFRILATLMPPSEGTATVFGRDAATDAAAVRPRIGSVFQSCALDESLTVTENLRFQGALYGLRGAALRNRMTDLLNRFGVADRAHDPVHTLSGGLQRRVDLARGLLHRPDLVLLDEPTSGLDPVARRSFWTAIDRLQRTEGTTLLLATHLMDEAERCDGVAILSDGACVAEGTPASLKAALGDETLWLTSDDPDALRDCVEAQFGVAARVVGPTVQIDVPDAPALLSSIYAALGDRIERATVRAPTLDDVFVVHAGPESDLNPDDVGLSAPAS